jgi:hypothetical protein
MRILRAVLGAGLCVASTLLASPEARAADAPALVGHWERNAELSQDAVSKVFASLSPRGTGFAPDEQTFHDALLRFAAVTASLEIEQTAEEVTIILGGDEVQIYYPGGPRVRQGVLGGRLEVLTQWRGDELVIQEKNEFGTLAQSLSVDRDGRLFVLVSLEDRRLRAPLLLLSVYDRLAPQP